MDIESQNVDITGNSSTNNGEGMREKFEEEAIKRQEMLWRQEEEEEQRRAEAREKARQMRKWKVFVFVFVKLDQYPHIPDICHFFYTSKIFGE